MGEPIWRFTQRPADQSALVIVYVRHVPRRPLDELDVLGRDLRSYSMSKSEIAVLNRAIALLRSLTDEPHAVDAIPRSGALTRFVRDYLVADPAADISCAEAWSFFCEVASSGELKPIRQSEFFRRLPPAMESVYNVRKSHNIQRDGRRVRGFRGIGFR